MGRQRPIGRRLTPRQNVNPAQRWSILQRDEFRCLYCGVEGVDGARLEVDHIDPEQGAEDWNLLTACHTCNAGKGYCDAGMVVIHNTLYKKDYLRRWLDKTISNGLAKLVAASKAEAREEQ